MKRLTSRQLVWPGVNGGALEAESFPFNGKRFDLLCSQLSIGWQW